MEDVRILFQADLARMYNICNCISHIYPRAPSMSICNQTQLKCVYESSSLIYNNQYPHCVPDCEATLYTSFKNFKFEGSAASAHFDVNFLPGPSRRYVRYVVHSKLDVVGKLITYAFACSSSIPFLSLSLSFSFSHKVCMGFSHPVQI